MKKKLGALGTLLIGSVVGFVTGYIIKAYQDLEKINDSSLDEAEDIFDFDPPVAPNTPMACDFDGDPLVDCDGEEDDSFDTEEEFKKFRPFILTLNDGREIRDQVHENELELFKGQWFNRTDLIDELNKFDQSGSEIPRFEEGSFVGEWLKGIIEQKNNIIREIKNGKITPIKKFYYDRFGIPTRFDSQYYTTEYNIEEGSIYNNFVVLEDDGKSFTVYKLTKEEFDRLDFPTDGFNSYLMCVPRSYFNSKMLVDGGAKDENNG